MDQVPQAPRRLPPEVYRRRRIVVAFALIVIVAVTWLAIRAITSSGADTAAPSATPSPTATAAPSASPSPTVTTSTSAEPAAIADCTATDVAVALGTPDVSADAVTFPVTLTQIGTVECLLDGTVDTSLLITSGDTRVWMSTDCDATAAILDTSWLLQPGAEETTSVAWPREWSFEGCGSSNDVPQPGYYYAELTVQGITAERLQFQIG
ncbi:hypothetical protein [Demequina lignilytica]|uniref:Ig-like domain-containing protein n=1 Tax=Demequina lignilytica TaxID=3051663 RepID=A0AAW7M0S7_9MICO|nr:MULTISPECIES: hypothetical protein [unclassified Demequina]MDN4477970.1 hypothetical protein [Demequina sp. SYSU T00039-1]MDN4484251.1 hypothetical protein [Demequina sp. SYSU T0a273]MDN4487879.1 hypothetical protein [Demequina sp. SYSU T00039]MDN4490738.1 hypothetical protein [Demequina sp. SYSU T00068]